jgi:hypothetical protein
MAAAIDLVVPIPIGWIVVLTAAGILALQVLGSCETTDLYSPSALSVVTEVGCADLRCLQKPTDFQNPAVLFGRVKEMLG